MGEYEVQFVASAAKEFRALPDETKRRIGREIDKLQENPCPSSVRKLVGHERLYRIRVGSYRVIYEIHDETKLIRITGVRHRRDAYR